MLHLFYYKNLAELYYKVYNTHHVEEVRNALESFKQAIYSIFLSLS